MHLAYITTGYPYVSHTFIQNEVLALRECGVRVDTYAVRREPLSECRTEADREAYRTTRTLRPIRAGRYVMAHVRALRRDGRAYAGALRRALELAGSAPRDIVRHLAYFVQAVVLAEDVLASGAEHVHAHFANVSSDLAMLASLASGGKVSWSFTLHGPREFADAGHFRLAEKAAAAKFVVCISDFARSQLMIYADLDSWDKFHVIRCGVDVGRFSPAQERPAPSGRVRIACVGRLVPEKGQAVLIRAVARLVTQGHDVEVVFVGDGPTRSALEDLAADSGMANRITFLGSRAPDEVIEVLRSADVFCLPSFSEGVPIVLMEAMAMEIPTVACRIAGIPELIESGRSGVLVPPGSEAELTQALDRLLSSPDRRRTLGEMARRQVATQYGLAENARQLAGCFAQALGHASVSAPEDPGRALVG